MKTAEIINEGVFDFTDKPSDSDELKISTHINGLASFLTNCATPMTISIQGEWGTGKSSIMKQVIKKIENEKNDRVLNIWFDTWLFSQFTFDEQLPVILLSRLVSKIIEHDKDKDTTTQQERKLQKTIRKLTGIVGNTVNDVFKHQTGVDLHKIINSEDQSTDIDTEDQNIYKEIEDIRSQFETLTDESEYERFVIYIDDLDRLAPDKAVELLEVLKVFLDVKKCVFVLAIDYDVVLRGISKKYGFDLKDRKELEKGKNFFDKIIQVPYIVPLKDYDFSDFIDNFLKSPELENLVDSGINHQDFNDLLITSVGKNPRTIKRILNSFHLNSLTKKDNDSEDTPGNENLTLLALLCMQNAYPYTYSYFMNSNKDLSVLQELLNYKEIDKSSVDTELLEELNNEESKLFLKQVINIIKAVDGTKLEEILSNSSNTFVTSLKSSSRLIELSTLEELIEYNSEHFQRNITYSIDSLQKLENEIYNLSDKMRKRYLINKGITVIQFKIGNSNIAEIKLNINSFSVECVLGKNLENNEILNDILDKYQLSITSANKVTFKNADLNILDKAEVLEDLLKVIKLRIDSK